MQIERRSGNAMKRYGLTGLGIAVGFCAGVALLPMAHGADSDSQSAYQALDEYELLLDSKLTHVPPMQPRRFDPDFQRWFGSSCPF